MALYNRLDVALDPVGGLTGGTTTCDALWMGVPVVTLNGNRQAERMTTSMLAALGHEEWGAADEDEYVEIVAQLAANSALRRELRYSLRDTMRNSPLCDATGLAHTLENAYEAMFDRWIAERP
jgi:predicted O-linked N-acetylglucosamine transferase (SPINDLY family)